VKVVRFLCLDDFLAGGCSGVGGPGAGGGGIGAANGVRAAGVVLGDSPGKEGCTSSCCCCCSWCGSTYWKDS